MDVVDHLRIAQHLFGAIVGGRVEAVHDLYAPDAVIWHNSDGVEQSVDDNLRVLSWVVKHIRDLRYEEVRCQSTGSGFVQQHVLRGTAPNGRELNIPACLIATIRDGRIARLDEYLDSAHLAPLLDRQEVE